MLRQLVDHNVVAKKTKCSFGVPDVIYLEYRISAQGRSCLKDRVEAMLEAREPENVAELCTLSI